AAEHNSFTDYQTVLPGLAERLTLPQGLPARMTGTVDPARFTAIRRAYLTAFFDRHLRGRHQPLLQPSPTPPERAVHRLRPRENVPGPADLLPALQGWLSAV
ncbi:hypothetical protein CF166_35735, partial [Amycolatopsis sp. KNN50.9b]